MLSRTGLPEPLVDKIDLATANTRSGWVIQRSTLQFSDARLTMNGTVSLATLELDEPEEEPLAATERLIAFHKKAREYEDYLNRVSGLEANIAIRSVRNEPRSIRAYMSADSAFGKIAFRQPAYRLRQTQPKSPAPHRRPIGIFEWARKHPCQSRSCNCFVERLPRARSLVARFNHSRD